MGAFALKPTVTLDANVGAAYEKTKIGVLLLNLGGPDDLDAVEPFLCAGTHQNSAAHDARSTLTGPRTTPSRPLHLAAPHPPHPPPSVRIHL